MCSACASDDPKPEMFTVFAVPSPVRRPTFAFGHAKRRRSYRTLQGGANREKTAWLQGFLRVAALGLRRIGCHFALQSRMSRSGILAGRARRGDENATAGRTRDGNKSVAAAGRLKHSDPEREAAISGEFTYGASTRRVQEPLDIFVSAGAIIEVYGASDFTPAAREFRARSEAWRGFAYGAERASCDGEATRSLAKAIRARAARTIIAYTIFAAAAAAAIWFLLK